MASPDESPAVQDGGSPTPVLVLPVHEGGVRKNRGINIPLNMALAPERRVSVGFAASNSYLNPARLCRRVDNVCEVAYETDHTGNLWFVDLRQPLSEFWELGFGIGTYRLDDIPDWALPHRFASDMALRSFHHDLIEQEGLAVKSGAPDGRQVFSLEDPAGRDLVLTGGQGYALPLRVDFVRYVDLRRNAHAHMGLNLGVHVSVPLEGGENPAAGQTAFARGTDVGIAVNFVRTVQTTANLTSSFHVQLARFRSDVSVEHATSPVNGDDPLRSQYALTYGLGFAGTFRGRAPCAFSIGQVTNTAHYDKDMYWGWDLVIPEGGNNVRGALAGANDYGVATFSCERRRTVFQIAAVEDIAGFSQLVTDDGSGASYDTDFAVSVGVSFELGR